MRALIVGCGYVGTALGAELVRLGHHVTGLRRSADGAEALRAAGIEPATADIARVGSLSALTPDYEWVINTVSSTRGGAEEYRAIYRDGMANLIAWLAGSPLKKFVYTSSTSVYGQTDGSLVKETSSTEPASETSRVLVEAEATLLGAVSRDKFPAVVLRVAGIYGPGRGHLFQQYLRDEARISGKGDRLINMIHRDDVVGAILAALKNGRPGEIYNAVDDEPVPQIHFFRWLSETLGKYMPPFATEAEDASRKRGLTQKKVSNRKLRMELGCPLRYPTFRQGYTAEIKRLDDAGQLDIAAAPR